MAASDASRTRDTHKPHEPRTPAAQRHYGQSPVGAYKSYHVAMQARYVCMCSVRTFARWQRMPVREREGDIRGTSQVYTKITKVTIT